VVKQSMKAGLVNEMEYSALAAEIESIHNRMQKLKEQQAERALRENRVEELRDYLMAQRVNLTKFDEELFRRFVEKVTVQSMAEVTFVLKVGGEVTPTGSFPTASFKENLTLKPAREAVITF